ncbi:MAG: radical SAM protein [Candidatus Omnitrophica bacterium]|nr:radical SAM protein [Candidatus Omnitrophota bacterium]
MKTRRFRPEEVLFSATTLCNLRCAHCDIKQRQSTLPKKTALRFLGRCAKAGIKRVGFTGGEPFLALDFLCAITKETVRHGMLFSRIMTNAGWFQTKKELLSALNCLFRAGYDGDFCVSVDAFHRQNLRKVACFVKAVTEIWKRPDIVSIASVKGAKEAQTRRRLIALAQLLNARCSGYPNQHVAMKNNDLFVKIFSIELSAVSKAARLKNAWNEKWFRDDFCKNPGNVFFVLPDGTVKPCCGYATDADILTIGSIKRDTPQKLLRNALKNRFVAAIFESGFHPIRKHLERHGLRFPGKTTNHCFFCYYLTHYLPQPLLEEYLDDVSPRRRSPCLPAGR